MEQIAKEYQALRKNKEILLQKYGDFSKVDDSFLASKMQNIHQTMVHLRYLLSMEKQQLEREKFATQSMMTLRQLYARTPFCFGPSYPPPQNSYYPLNIDWSNYVVTPNYEYQFCSDPPYKNHYEDEFDSEPSKDHLCENKEPFGLYKGHLDDVEMMCNSELEKVESKINHLKKLRKAWDCTEITGPALPRRLRKRAVRRSKSNECTE